MRERASQTSSCTSPRSTAIKRRARRGAWRTSEAALHLLEFMGGWPGALIAQQRLRHKNRKLSFQLVFWFIVLMHQFCWLVWMAAPRST